MSSEAIDRAVCTHGLWKSRLRRAIERGEAERTLASVPHESLCELGRLLQRPELALGSVAPQHLERLRVLHAEFHRVASKVLDLALTGQKEEALRFIDAHGPFTEVSMLLVREMMAWKHACAVADTSRSPVSHVDSLRAEEPTG